MAVNITWEEPPRPPGGPNRRKDRTDHRAIGAELKTRPGEWARIDAYATASMASSMAYHIRTGRLSGYAPAGVFDAVARTVKGEHLVYACYLGKESTDE